MNKINEKSMTGAKVIYDEINAIMQYLCLINESSDIEVDKIAEIIGDEVDHIEIGLKMFKENFNIEEAKKEEEE